MLEDYKDTLELFDDLIASGVPESQARAQAKQLGSVSTVLERIESDLRWMRNIGAAMTVCFFANMITMWCK